MKSSTILLICSLFIGQFALAQPAQAWAARYNGPADNADESRSIALDDSGNVYVTGAAFSATNTLDIVTVKYNSAGQQQWVQAYDGTGLSNDEGYEIAVSDSGNVYVIGYSTNSASLQDITTIKYNSAGVQQWVKLYNGAFNNYDAGKAISVDAAGNVYVTGVETVTNYTYDIVTIKYGPGGAQLWAVTFNGPGNFNDESYDIGLDATNNVYVSGTQDTFYNSMPNEDIVLLKYNSSGTFQWRRSYDSPSHAYENGRKLAIDGNNNIYVTGFGFITGNGNDIFILKWNSAGAFQWMQTYNSAPNKFEQPTDIITDANNNVIISAMSIQANNNNYNDFLTVKYNSAGTFQWAERYDGPAATDDRAFAVAVDDSMNIYVTGESKGTGTLYDCTTIKYNPAGTQQYVLRYNNSVNKDDFGNDIAVANGDIYVTGMSANLSNNDYITIRYSYSVIGMQEQNAGAVALEVFPNPASGTISIGVPSTPGAGSSYEMIVTNAIGQEVRRINSQPGESTGDTDVLQLSTTGLEAGIYSVKIYREKTLAGVARIVVR
jgi:uncharacterized delta-60 repeat protein